MPAEQPEEDIKQCPKEVLALASKLKSNREEYLGIAKRVIEERIKEIPDERFDSDVYLSFNHELLEYREDLSRSEERRKKKEQELAKEQNGAVAQLTRGEIQSLTAHIDEVQRALQGLRQTTRLKEGERALKSISDLINRRNIDNITMDYLWRSAVGPVLFSFPGSHLSRMALREIFIALGAGSYLDAYDAKALALQQAEETQRAARRHASARRTWAGVLASKDDVKAFRQIGGVVDAIAAAVQELEAHQVPVAPDDVTQVINSLLKLLTGLANTGDVQPLSERRQALALMKAENTISSREDLELAGLNALDIERAVDAGEQRPQMAR